MDHVEKVNCLLANSFPFLEFSRHGDRVFHVIGTSAKVPRFNTSSANIVIDNTE